MSPARIFPLLFLLCVWSLACTEEKPQDPLPPLNSAVTTETETTAPSTLPNTITAPSTPPNATATLPTPPNADRYDIIRRLKPASHPAPRPAQTTPAPRRVGDTSTFSVTDAEGITRRNVPATLHLVTDHAYWYLDDSIRVDMAALQSSAQVYEARSYPTNTKHFGDTIRGGYDGDPHLTVFITRFRGAVGYYSSPDEYPKAIHPFSNERLMLYINGNALPPGSRGFNSVVAHELQHAIHWHADPNEDSWVNEGLSVLAEEFGGFRSNSARSFQSATNVQLTDWEDAPGNNRPHYAAAHLFMRFLAQHWSNGGDLSALVAEPKDGVDGVDAYLAKQGYAERFRDVFKAWVAANSGARLTGPKLRYLDRPVTAAVSRTLTTDATFTDTVKQYAAKYFDIQASSGAATITFSGTPGARLLPTQATSGVAFWWGNRGDQIDSTLTREFDLTNAQTANLRFKTWYDIEEGWDYAYVVASIDGGDTWQILPGGHTTVENPSGNSYGPGYTGHSGGGRDPQWVQETIDLSQYVGGKVLVRFEYITDDAVNTDGFAIDDIEVPEIGFHDANEQDSGWTAQGFYRTDNLLPQEFLIQVVEQTPNGTAVLNDMELDANHQSELRVCCFGQELAKATVIVAAIAPATTQQAHFKMGVRFSN